MDYYQLTPKAVARFRKKFEQRGPDECWNWGASFVGGGYGQYGPGSYAHRFSYRLYKGPIPNGLFVLHTCDNRRCVNPSHLFVGTNYDNVQDMVSKGRQSGAKGERSGKAKLTEKQVREIRQRYKRWRANRSNVIQLASEFGMSVPQIQAIVARKQWKHI